MNKAESLLTHLTVILSLMFVVCLSGILRSILCWRHSGREEAGEERS